MKRIVLVCLSLLLSATLFSETRFSGLDLSDDNRLLFRATTESPGTGEFHSLFQADLEKETLTQLSFFPEKVTYLAETQQLQIQNRFGVFRSTDSLSNMKPVSQFPAFVNGEEVQTGKLDHVVASPDGGYLLYIVPRTYGYGDLKLYVVEENKRIDITENIQLSFSGPNASWSPNSQFFVYSKAGELYYYSIDQLLEKRVVSEKLRKIGEGNIKNARWNKQNNLYFITGSRVYEIFSGEFFTRSIYSNLLEIGRIIGKIPFQFDHNFDSFVVSPDGSRILVNKGGSNLFLYYLGTEDFLSTGATESMPYLYLPRNTRVKRILWSKDNIITILTGSIKRGVNETSIFRFNPEETDSRLVFYKTADTNVKDIILAPDERRAALVFEEKVLIKRYRSWKDDKTFTHSSPLNVLWKSDMELIIAGKQITERVGFQDENRELISFSQIDKYGFSKGDGNILVEVSDMVYELVDRNWVKKDDFAVAPRKVYSPDYRVYIERAPSGSYHNVVMVRDQKGYRGTDFLFPPPERSYEEFPREEKPVDFFNFTHGSRIRRREVALVFNAVDSVEGLTEVLNILSEYSIQSTFFINGEYIRRNPGAVKEIAYSEHEVGSLFYTYFNMTDATYTVTKEFVKQGLARNEDDYFRVTGEELSLLWHAPYYFVNSQIIEAGNEMNYQYVGRDIDSLDWVTKEMARDVDGYYMTAAKLVERIMELKKPGSIIPIRLGMINGTRDDYLFQKLDALINGLISLGYTIVPVSALIEHAR